MQDGLEKTGQKEVRRQLAGRIAAIENLQPRLQSGQQSGQQSGLNGVADGGLSGQGSEIAQHAGQRAAQRVKLGIEEIDRALDPDHGRGIEYGGLHEIRSQTTLSFAAAAGFALVLGNHMERVRFQRSQGFKAFETGQPERGKTPVEAGLSQPLRPVFWIAERFCKTESGDFYGPGLYPLGIDPGRLIRVLPRNFEEAIWAAGEISRAGRIAFALMEVRGNPHKLDLAVTRRLLLRCRTSHLPFFILRQAGLAQSSAVSTRWLVEPALSQHSSQDSGSDLVQTADRNRLMGMTAWNINLEKCRGGKTGDWTLEWNHHEQTLQIANRAKTDHSGKSRPHRYHQPARRPAGQVIRHQALSGGFITAAGN